MLLVDVNVLLYAHRRDAARHKDYRRWLESVLAGPGAYGLSDLVVSAFIRIVTHRKVFNPPSTLDEALAFAAEIRGPGHRVSIVPGERHWEIFTRLCRETRAPSKLVPDAYLAALAIESGCEWITTDGDFARFRGLRVRHPLA